MLATLLSTSVARIFLFRMTRTRFSSISHSAEQDTPLHPQPSGFNINSPWRSSSVPDFTIDLLFMYFDGRFWKQATPCLCAKEEIEDGCVFVTFWRWKSEGKLIITYISVCVYFLVMLCLLNLEFVEAAWDWPSWYWRLCIWWS